MNLLLPSSFKKAGLIITPLGFLFWLSMQKGLITAFLVFITNEGRDSNGYLPAYFASVNTAIAIIGFFGFLAGLYCIAFSKEPIEDEMIQKTRLESFQFAALVQFILIVAGFLFMLLAGEPKEGGMMLFFIGITLTFWLCFIARFNYALRNR